MKEPANISKQVAHVYYELEALVDANKLRAYTNRIRIAENSMVAMELANAAFNESRQQFVKFIRNLWMRTLELK